MALTERYVTSTGTDTYANSTNSGTPMSLTTAFANAVAGDRINIKNDGTYTRTATDTPANSGTVTSPIIYRGYSSTIGDGFLGRSTGSSALTTTNMPTLAYNSTFRLNPGVFTLLESLIATGNVATTTIGMGTDSLIKSCKVTNSNTGASVGAIGMGSARAIAFDCDAELLGASGGLAAISTVASLARVVCCRIKGGTAVGISCNANGGALIYGNLIFSQSGNGISIITGTTVSPHILFNTFVGGGADAINVITGTTTLGFIFGNMFTDHTGDAIDMVSTSNGAFLAYNRTRDNANAINNGGDWTTATTYAHVTTDTGGPETDYINSGSNDYRLIIGSPARNAGWPLNHAIGALQPSLEVASFGSS